MKKWIVILFAMLPSLAMAAGANVPLDKANNDLSDQASLQNGAKLFMNYCFGCHSAQYQRYERVARDIGIPVELMKENLIFDPEAKVGDLMENAIPETSAAKWFGAPPPDLTLVARVRGADWLYTYLRSFYADPTRPFGVNNIVFQVLVCHTYWKSYRVFLSLSLKPKWLTAKSTKLLLVLNQMVLVS